MAELARDAWGDPALAARLDADADELARRFDEAFWIDERRTYALALDARKQRVDSLSSNIGHLLWSGIVPSGRRPAVAAALTGEALWSGWGIRTMGAGEAAYNPLSYHNGTVWPHDTALAAWGLARRRLWEESDLLAASLIEASASFDYSLPEVFAGYDRTDTAFPIAYPTAARPQAWAAGAPVLCLTLLLGLRPDPAAGRLVSDRPSAPPAWLVGTRLDGVRALGSTWNVVVEPRAVVIEPRRPSWSDANLPAVFRPPTTGYRNRQSTPKERKEQKMSMNDPRELFLHELKDVYFAENTLVKALPKMISEASDKELSKGLENHLAETRQQVENLEKVFASLGEKAEGERCPGIEGIKAEHDEFMKEEQPSSEICDMFLTGAAARAEHYEIAAYTGLIAMARGLGERESVRLLDENLKQEKEALKLVDSIGRRMARDARELTAA